MARKNIGESLIANVLIIVLIVGSFSSINLNEKTTDSQLFEHDFEDLPKMFSQRNSNDWSTSASASNPMTVS